MDLQPADYKFVSAEKLFFEASVSRLLLYKNSRLLAGYSTLNKVVNK
jgi:hypothetical protein